MKFFLIKHNILIPITSFIIPLFLFFILHSNGYAHNIGEYNLGLYIAGGYNMESAKMATGTAAGNALASDSSLWENHETENTISYSAGAEVNYFFLKYVSVLSGIFYQHKPFVIKYPSSTATEDIKITIDYKALSLFTGLRLNLGWFFIGGGAFYSLLLDDQSYIRYATTTSDVSKQLNLSNRNDAGIFADIGIGIPISSKNSISIYARYEKGLRKVYKNSGLIKELTTSTLMVYLGYRFHFK